MPAGQKGLYDVEQRGILPLDRVRQIAHRVDNRGIHGTLCCVVACAAFGVCLLRFLQFLRFAQFVATLLLDTKAFENAIMNALKTDYARGVVHLHQFLCLALYEWCGSCFRFFFADDRVCGVLFFFQQEVQSEHACRSQHGRRVVAERLAAADRDDGGRAALAARMPLRRATAVGHVRVVGRRYAADRQRRRLGTRAQGQRRAFLALVPVHARRRRRLCNGGRRSCADRARRRTLVERQRHRAASDRVVVVVIVVDDDACDVDDKRRRRTNGGSAASSTRRRRRSDRSARRRRRAGGPLALAGLVVGVGVVVIGIDVALNVGAAAALDA